MMMMITLNAYVSSTLVFSASLGNFGGRLLLLCTRDINHNRASSLKNEQ
jgi:hypothetical protein